MNLPRLALAFAIVGAACAGNDGDTAADSGDADTSAGMTTAPTSTTVDPTSSTTSSMTASTTASTSDATEESGPGTETTPADTGSTGEPSDPCAIASDDTECDMCVKGMCCDQLTQCDADPECVCFQECASAMEPSLDTPMICGTRCGIDTPFAHPTVGQVLSCSSGCIDVCV